jgi:hypothetical protein
MEQDEFILPRDRDSRRVYDEHGTENSGALKFGEFVDFL